MVFRIKPFDEPKVISRRLIHIAYDLYGLAGSEPPRLGDGAGLSLITMDTAFAEMPDAVWLGRVLPNATITFRSNSRDVQARLYARGAGLAVLPQPLGDVTPGLARLGIDDVPPGRDTFVGYHRDMKRQRRMRALLELLVERLAN